MCKVLVLPTTSDDGTIDIILFKPATTKENVAPMNRPAAGRYCRQVSDSFSSGLVALPARCALTKRAATGMQAKIDMEASS
jgi:hypothetical protein